MTAPMPDYSKLTDSEINRLCAERVLTANGISKDKLLWKDVPDYCRDRNALVELYGHLGRTSREREFVDLLHSTCSEPKRYYKLQDFDIITATPRQHCEAFLMATEGQG